MNERATETAFQKRKGIQIQSQKRLERKHEITRLTKESKWATWHRHLVRISKSNVVKQVLPTMRSLSGKESRTLKCRHCTELVCTPANARWPQLSFRITLRSTVLRITGLPVIRISGKQSRISDT